MTDAQLQTEVPQRLELLNQIARHDEPDRRLTYPYEEPSPEDERFHNLLERTVASTMQETISKTVWSFDIDLTLAMPDDSPCCRGHIPVKHLIQLQRDGSIVGTCSDREPSNQRAAMTAIGFTPDFCIPKEMLATLKRLLPDANIVHVGDDPKRDREVALACQVEHRWPNEA